MKRDIKQLSDKEFDVCIIGGGIYGACAAWDATLRGLSVALIEKSDFGHATSFNSQNTIHGGFRYLQNLDIPRIRASVKERRTWMAIAPHLVHPLPFLIPIYKNFSKPKGLFSLAFKIYDILSIDRNQLSDPEKKIPSGRIISPQECLQLFPELEDRYLTGGALFYDALIHNPWRLCFSFLKSATKAGAVVANYAEATEFLQSNRKIIGVKVKDQLGKTDFVLRAKTFVNMSGPWAGRVLAKLKEYNTGTIELLKVMYLAVKRPVPKAAIGLLGKHGKYYFVLPWHNHSLVGIAELPHVSADLDELKINEKDVASFISEINRARPHLGLRREDVVAIRKGLLPANERQLSSNGQQLAKKARVIDHGKDGLNNMISVMGIKFTMARSVAEQIIDLVFSKLGRKVKKCQTHTVRIHGGNIERFDDFVSQAADEHKEYLGRESVRRLILNYGSEYQKVLKYKDCETKKEKCYDDGSKLLKAEVRHAVHEEMAQKLIDVVLRRTELGLLGSPNDYAIKACAEIVAKEMNWDPDTKEKEIQQTKTAFL